MTKEQNVKESMDFESQLTDKEDILGEEIRIVSVGAEKLGSMGSNFRVADIEYDGKTMQISLGQVLSKQWNQWFEKMATKATPCIAVVKKDKGKRYYAFSSITEA